MPGHMMDMDEELPPRTRRIHGFIGKREAQKGTTSAYAENTSHRGGNLDSPWNYLRVRGEYNAGHVGAVRYVELPPRTRRIQVGTIGMEEPIRNYLRVRGEYAVRVYADPETGELPPRTRRIPIDDVQEVISRGTTSAYAEKTP